MPAETTIDLAATLPVGPEVRVVTLANGFTTWIRRNLRPPSWVLLCLTVQSGSLVEEEHQRGLAHFIEHLAFRGTERFPPGAAERFFAAVGTRLGSHHNATTSLEKTCYTLFLPAHDARTVDRGILCLADIAWRMSFPPQEVAGQRQVILEEMRSVQGWQEGLREQAVARMLPGARVSHRHPLGTEEVVREACATDLRSWYTEWYRPDNTTLFVVGEVQPDTVEGSVRRHFGDWPRPPGPPPEVDLGIAADDSTRVAVLSHARLTHAQLGVVSVAAAPRKRTVGDLRARRVEKLAGWILSRRLGALVQTGEAPYRDGQVTIEPMLGVCMAVQAQVSGAAGRLPAMLRALVQELRRARVHGVPEQELEVARASVLNAANQALLSEPNRSSASIVEGMHAALADGRPPMSRAQSHALITALVEGISATDVHAWLRSRLGLGGKLLLALVPEHPEGSLPAAAELLDAAIEADTETVDAPVIRPRPRRLLERTPTPGVVVECRRDPELGVASAELANGVRLNLREMDYAQHRVFARLTIAGGRIEESAHDLGITMAAALIGTLPACRSVDSMQIREWMAGRSLVFSMAVEEDCITVDLVADPRSLEDGLQLLHLLLTQPVIEAVALERWHEQIEVSEARRRASLEARLAERSLQLLAGADPRLRPITAGEARRIDLELAQQWLERLIAGPIEAAIVGDLAEERALELVATYLGSLPARDPAERRLDDLRQLRGDLVAREDTVIVPCDPSRAAALTGWRAAPWSARRERHLLDMAQPIARHRLLGELRERLGLTYHADCSFRPSRAYPRASLLAASCLSSPPNIRQAQDATRAVIEGLAASGPSEPELETTRQHLLDVIAKDRLEPRYWCRVLSDLHSRGTRLEELQQAELLLGACTVEDVQQTLARCVTASRRLSVVALPDGAVD
jgi:zinc protease